MIKSLTRICLLLFILLVCGHGQLSAQINHYSHTLSAARAVEEVDTDIVHNPLLNRCPSSHKGKQHRKIHVREVREEEENRRELNFSRKKSEGGNFFTAFFCSKAPYIFSSCTQERLPFSRHFSYPSSHRRHLIFRVFTI